MFGSGSTVSVVDRRATFDIINSSYTAELGNYQEGGLSVTTGSQAWGADPPMAARLDPFHLPGGGRWRLLRFRQWHYGVGDYSDD